MAHFGGKGIKLGLGTVIGAALIGIAASSSTDANAQIVSSVTRTIPRATTVSIACSNPGSSQDVAKTPILKNTAQTTIYKGQRLNWWASDGDLGQVTLAADLPPGATVKAMGKAGNAYTCTSGYVAQPDLKIRTAKMVSSTQALVEVQNADPYVGASASSVLFELRSCQSNAILATSKSAPLALAKSEYKQLTFAVPAPPSGKTYVRAIADVGNDVSESNEMNNGWNGQNGCLY